jgi:hypothetical protein
LLRLLRLRRRHSPNLHPTHRHAWLWRRDLRANAAQRFLLKFDESGSDTVLIRVATLGRKSCSYLGGARVAQRVEIVLVDDLDGSDASETVRFNLNGQDYEIDLSESNGTALRELLTVYVNAGRRVAASRRRPGRRKAAGA